MQGAVITLLTLGFKYSDDAFFHRHESQWSGPVLFRVVTDVQPRHFDVDNMECSALQAEFIYDG